MSTPPATLLDETLEAWRDAREGIVAEVENLPAKQMGWRPVEGVRSITELVQHILEVSMMMTGELTRPDTDFGRKPWPELLAMYAKPAYQATSRAALLRLLTDQMHEAEEKFRAAGELQLYQFIRRFDGAPGTKFTWLQHGIAQEMYHRGQLALYARLLGLVPALTRQIQGG